MGVILALVNQKGGCGKTTSALHIAAAYAGRDFRVLLVDLDPQGHAGMGLGVEPDPARSVLSDILALTPLTGVGVGLDQAIQAARPNLDFVPANLGLAGLELRLATVPGREERLAEHLAEIAEGWDLIVLDSPPNLGLLTVNALVAAGEALIPLEPSPFAVQGIERVLETIRLVEDRTGHRITPRVLPTMIAPSDPFAIEIVERFREAHPALVLDAVIRRSILFPRAASVGKTVGELATRSGAWQDYLRASDVLAEVWHRALVEGRPRFVGLRAVEGGIEFSHPDFGPGEVLLAGEFNGWTPDRGVETLDGDPRGWKKRMPLPPGRYEYKFIVRGEWITDPANPRRAQDGVGAVNSIIDVPRRPSPPPAPPFTSERAQHP